MAEKDVVDTEKLFLAVGAGTFLTIATVFAVQALYYWKDHEWFLQKNLEAPRELIENRERAIQQISAVKKIEGTDRYVIPIEHAEKLVLEEAKTR
jgi:hypothetical protein